MKIVETKNRIEIISNLYSYQISKPLITNIEIITLLGLGFPKDITEKIIKTIKEDNLQTKIHLLTIEFELKKMFNKYTIYHLDENDLSEIFSHESEDSDNILYDIFWSYNGYDSDNYSLDLEFYD